MTCRQGQNDVLHVLVVPYGSGYAEAVAGNLPLPSLAARPCRNCPLWWLEKVLWFCFPLLQPCLLQPNAIFAADKILFACQCDA